MIYIYTVYIYLQFSLHLYKSLTFPYHTTLHHPTAHKMLLSTTLPYHSTPTLHHTQYYYFIPPHHIANSNIFSIPPAPHHTQYYHLQPSLTQPHHTTCRSVLPSTISVKKKKKKGEKENERTGGRGLTGVRLLGQGRPG